VALLPLNLEMLIFAEGGKPEKCNLSFIYLFNDLPRLRQVKIQNNTRFPTTRYNHPFPTPLK
jgi:hypothetical protein